MVYERILRSLSDTDQFGATLAKSLPDGSIVAMTGTLGAGKTRLVQAVAVACGLDPSDITSPTFVLIQEYHGDRDICHFDLYRLECDAEFLNLGPDEYFESDGLTFLEWADRFESLLPEERVTIRLDVLSPDERRVTVTAVGDRYQTFLRDLCEEQKIRERKPEA
ncbi:MAG: tRNA (adenosine(37)-N6)-threonylcarbamoyltransferase complex ATPase subunit type 1 TsaE [Planctomycetia bacterium]|nr:tRNA (adenosine(37)-N6)-threonylcarbamoyltransferase complex ATPase subunit type 1 TsaE [Planctomycetia bacterium]